MNNEAYTSQIDELAMALAHAEARIGELEATMLEQHDAWQEYTRGLEATIARAKDVLETT